MITTNVNGTAISQGFINEIRSDSPNVIARLWYNNAEIECDIVDITVEKGSCGSDPFMIGEVIGDSLQATVKNLSADIKDEVIECHIGALVNGAYEYISLGKYKVSSVKKTRYQSEITAYSGIVADSGKAFNNSGLTNPTIAGLAIRLQSDLNCTISFDTGIDTTPIITAQLTELTDYQALQILAICCGGYAINTIDGNIVVKKYDATPTLEVDTGMMVNLPEIAEAEYSVGQIGVLVSDATTDNEGADVDAVYYSTSSESPETADVYFECAYMTEDIFDANIAPVVGYAYYPATVDLTLGDPRLEGCDVLQVEEVDGSLYAVPCHKVVHTYNGGFTTQVVSATASDKENSIGTEYPITQRLQNLDRQAGKAQATADNAYRIADNTNQYFWFRGTGTDTGAHITEIPQEQWDDPTSPYYQSGGNLLARSNGIAVRNGLTELATFGANGSQVGTSDGGHTTVQSSGMKVYGSDGTAELANIGYGSGNAQTGTAVAPYYSFGRRLSNSDIGNYSIAEGVDTTASAWASHAEGYKTIASGASSHAEGGAIIADGGERVSTASGSQAHAEGSGTYASALATHSEGAQTEANNLFSHAEGWQTKASGIASHAEGYETEASGNYSHAGGWQTKASGTAQTVVGTGNVADSSSLFIVGNGSSSARSNGMRVDANGNLNLKGDIFVGCNANSSGGTKLVNVGTVDLVVNHPYKATTTGWEYVGASFYVPSGHIYLVMASAGWSTGKPIGLGINSSSSIGSVGVPDYGFVENSSYAGRTPLLFLSQGTYYIFCKRATVPTGNNNHSAYAIDITI